MPGRGGLRGVAPQVRQQGEGRPPREDGGRLLSPRQRQAEGLAVLGGRRAARGGRHHRAHAAGGRCAPGAPPCEAGGRGGGRRPGLRGGGRGPGRGRGGRGPGRQAGRATGVERRHGQGGPALSWLEHDLAQGIVIIIISITVISITVISITVISIIQISNPNLKPKSPTQISNPNLKPKSQTQISNRQHEYCLYH